MRTCLHWRCDSFVRFVVLVAQRVLSHEFPDGSAPQHGVPASFSVSYVHARALRRTNVWRRPTTRPFGPDLDLLPHPCFVVVPSASHAPVVPIRESCEHACALDASQALHARSHASYGVQQSHLARALRLPRTCGRRGSVLRAKKRGACST